MICRSSWNQLNPLPPRPPLLLPPKPPELEEEPDVVVLLLLAFCCARSCNGLVVEVELVLDPLRDELLVWNMFCNTVKASCGSPLFMWKT